MLELRATWLSHAMRAGAWGWRWLVPKKRNPAHPSAFHTQWSDGNFRHMAVATFSSVRRQLASGNPDPVYYLTGPEELVKNDFAAEIADAVVDAGARDFNLDIRTAPDLDGESFTALVETPPMMADRRAVILKGLEQWRKNAKVWKVVFRYLENPSPQTVLVLIHGAGASADKQIASHATHLEARELRPADVRRWVVKHAESLGLKLEDDAAAHLIEAVAAELQLLKMELAKIAAASEAETVSVDEVARLVGVNRGETVNDWVQAVLTRELGTATELIDVVMPRSGVNGVRMLTALGTALIGARLATGLLDKGVKRSGLERQVFQEIRKLRPVGLSSWTEVASLWARAATFWSTTELNAAVEQLHETDLLLKSTTLSNDTALLRNLVLSIVPKRAAA